MNDWETTREENMVEISTEYLVIEDTSVELPKGMSCKDIVRIDMKWGKGIIYLKNGDKVEFTEEYSVHEFFKYPKDSRIWADYRCMYNGERKEAFHKAKVKQQ